MAIADLQLKVILPNKEHKVIKGTVGSSNYFAFFMLVKGQKYKLSSKLKLNA